MATLDRSLQLSVLRGSKPSRLANLTDGGKVKTIFPPVQKLFAASFLMLCLGLNPSASPIATALAQTDEYLTKACTLNAAAKLPQIAGLQIQGAKRRDPSRNPKGLAPTTRIIEIEVKAVGYDAVYSFACDTAGGNIAVLPLSVQ